VAHSAAAGRRPAAVSPGPSGQEVVAVNVKVAGGGIEGDEAATGGRAIGNVGRAG
jgi:hypothetical protein